MEEAWFGPGKGCSIVISLVAFTVRLTLVTAVPSKKLHSPPLSGHFLGPVTSGDDRRWQGPVA